ncbi:MAG: STAS domain-containing protein [Deltaproteobacteria bacterium]|nr:STAS domain-containing protein [Deltaproteobacteria bacterium]MBW2535433.1 STAS domain-containing protein [Deltaproteobacteria bacterium]
MSEASLQSGNELIAKLAAAINATAADQGRIIRQQDQAIQELSNPILTVWDDVLVVPIIGIVDSTRTAGLMDRMLASVVASQARCVIIDITGIEVVDTRTADNLIQMVKAARLVGARCVLTGIGSAVAQTLVEIGVDLAGVVTLRNLKDGLRECIRYLEPHGAGGFDG